ncbi:MAG TPA: class E sortase [Acidimicrobiales bacterium]|nr:class E sortase [Acidimicrobiales bacterium]
MPPAPVDRPDPPAWVRARRARRHRRRLRWLGCLAALVASNLGVQAAGVVDQPVEDAVPDLLRAAPVAVAVAAEDDSAIGGIEIPRLGLDVALHQGIEMKYINRGPSHWPGTALPGQPGNVVVAGHRTTRTKPFRHLDSLQPGDEVIFTMDGSRWVYRVTGSEVVPDTAMWITDQTVEPTATLFACHPPGSAKYRWVTRLALDQAASQPAAPQATATASGA